jgi:subtilisin-like proprotein convertase family protein
MKTLFTPTNTQGVSTALRLFSLLFLWLSFLLPLSAQTNYCLTTGTAVIFTDGATSKTGDDQINEISYVYDGSDIDVTITWLPSSSGFFTESNGVHLKAFFYDGAAWSTIYSNNMAPSGFTIDQVNTSTFTFTPPAYASGQYLRASIIDKADSGDEMTGNFACPTCGTVPEVTDRHHDNTDVLLNTANPTGPTWYADTDGDGYYGSGAATQASCFQPSGYLAFDFDNDCMPMDAATSPATIESCNGVDDNCNGIDDPAPITVFATLSQQAITCTSLPTTTLAASSLISFQGSSVTIPDSGPGNPYPSTIIASGLNPTAVTVKSIQINGMSHTFAGDVSIILESPSGTQVILSGNVGGSSGLAGDYIFMDGFPAFGSSSVAAGTYSASGGLLSGFTGDLNGTWKLLVYDGVSGDQGFITSWGITLGNESSLTYSWSASPAAIIANVASQVLTPTQSTTYTVVATQTGTGCTASATASVTVNATPATYYADPDNDNYYQTGASSIFACGEPANYAPAANSGDCLPNNAAVNPGMIEVCDGFDTDCNGTSEMNTACVLPTITPATTVSGNNVTFNWNTGCYKFYRIQYRRTLPTPATTWTTKLIPSFAISTTTISVTTPGTYKWGLVAGCYSPNQVSALVAGTNFVIGSTPTLQSTEDQIVDNQSVVIAPNPAIEWTEVRMEFANASMAIIRVTDMEGRVVFTDVSDLKGPSVRSIYTTNLPSGVYTVQIVTDGGYAPVMRQLLVR